ncbi:glycosyltransferase family 4 protein [Faunimonas pinastri]|nr:glycosyltransferase family 4 protein [Faunimonas pinastri]
MSKFAIYYEPEAYSLKGKLMGRQSAGAAFMRAVAKAAPERVWAYARARAGAEQMARELAESGAPKTGVAWVPFMDPKRLAEPGLLYRPDPRIFVDAWMRLSHANPRAYSLCGVTHTTASQSVMEALAGLVTAPLEEWDAIVCTSRAVRDSVRSLLENNAEYLRERTGATRFTLPQLPVIPLGVHCDTLALDEGRRAAARATFGIGEDETVVIFVGRLSFHGKAHPVPMYLGLEACAKDSKVTLIQAGWFGNDQTEKAFKDDAETLCPSVRTIYVDGRDQEQLRDVWASADIFTSLSDNVQETFGLTPIEAMASGLPVVVSDWDGYKDTVRDGIDGFRVPTTTLPPGSGTVLADRFDIGIDNYDIYCGVTSQLVAVDVAAVTEAYRKLITDPALRRRMGEAARQRARATFDWTVVFRRYQELWDDLGERRRSDASLHPPLTRRRRPDRPDPFTMFASYPTRAIGAKTGFRRIPGTSVDAAIARRDLGSTKFAAVVLPPPETITLILEALTETEWTTLETLAARTGRTVAALLGPVAWLSKVGALQFDFGSASAPAAS